MAPRDLPSHGLDVALRLLACLSIACLVLGLAGLHRPLQSIERTGYGAHTVLVMDRSLSMDEPFALVGQTATESKTVAASRMIGDFFDRRPHDSFGLVAFSTAPILVMPLTEHREAIHAALLAMRRHALANTNIGAGLSLALALFARDATDATRVLLFVSDGAGLIDAKVQAYIREEALRQHVHIYYLYLRAGDDPALSDDLMYRSDSTKPAALDAFFRSIGVPYQGFEAADANAIGTATRMIDALETRPITYREMVGRLDLDALCYGIAALCLALVLLARLAERELDGVVVRPRA
jgi:mxaC protein